jgi:uncharacterized protein involved in response to NO
MILETLMADTLTNQERLDRRRDYPEPEFLREGFRPLFMAAGLWAAISVPLWVAVWTGRLPVRGWPLAGLALLWLAGRLAKWLGGHIGSVPVALLDLLYLTGLGLCVANEIVAGRNWKMPRC